MTPRQGSDDQFWSRAMKLPSGCWEWQGYRNEKGYGRINRSGHVSAHRLAWELAHGLIPDGFWVLHRCDNPPCVNPAHLFLGTNQDNVDDRVSKDRTLRGMRHPQAKLTTGQIEELRRLRSMGWLHRELADHFGVGKRNVGDILSGKRRAAG